MTQLYKPTQEEWDDPNFILRVFDEASKEIIADKKKIDGYMFITNKRGRFCKVRARELDAWVKKHGRPLHKPACQK